MNGEGPVGGREEAFGLPGRISRAPAEQLSATLLELWTACHDREPAGVSADLRAHKKFFDPIATGKRLRGALLEIAPVKPPIDPVELQALRVDNERLLITPEGRVALELINRALEQEGGSVEIDKQLVERWQGVLIDLYREWGTHRLRSVIDLLGGGAKPLQFPAIGLVLSLMLNRSDSEERAVTRFPPGPARDVIDRIFRDCAYAFAENLAPSERRSKSKERLISGWTLGEITRRLPGAIESSDRAGVFIRRAHHKEIVKLVVDELRRRPEISKSALEDAFDAMVSTFRSNSQDLAGYDLLFERPADTARLKDELTTAWTESS